MDININTSASDPVHFTHSSDNPLLVKSVDTSFFHALTLLNVIRGNKSCSVYINLKHIVSMLPLPKKGTEITLTTGQSWQVSESVLDIINMCEEHAIFLEDPCPVDNTCLEQIG